MPDYDDCDDGLDYDPDMDGRTLPELADPFLPDPARTAWVLDPLERFRRHLDGTDRG